MNIIVAACKNRGIGYKNKLPWKLSKEMKYFKELTIGEKNNAVIMGRNTWLSIPQKNIPLPKRENIVLTSRVDNMFFKNQNKGVNFAPSLESIYTMYGMYSFDNMWIIGGERVYNDTLNKGLVDSIFYTEIDADYECDTFFPEIPSNFLNIYESDPIYDSGETIRFKVYTRKNNFPNSYTSREQSIRAEKKALL
tara:strand:- start:3808 stop:4389 length:582 start_codon:yes stop_codon:yes gene_type:complete